MKIIDWLALGAGIGLPGIIVQIFIYHRERKKLHVSPLYLAWSMLQSELANTLHRPHPESKELDGLLEKLETFAASGVSTISEDDRMKLTELLRQKVDDRNQPEIDRRRAEFLLLAMPRAQDERRPDD
jgi:hypothetical protein